MRRSPWTKRDMAERFWSHVNKSGDCWLWTASTFWTGYGQFRFTKRHTATAHRLAYELTVGPIPDGLWVLHRCDVRLCCNPDHLFLGTPQDNVRDMVAKGRHRVHKNYSRGTNRTAAKLTDERVVEIRRLVAAGASQKAVAARFGVSHSNVNRIVLGKAWSHVVWTP